MFDIDIQRRISKGTRRNRGEEKMRKGGKGEKGKKCKKKRGERRGRREKRRRKKAKKVKEEHTNTNHITPVCASACRVTRAVKHITPHANSKLFHLFNLFFSIMRIILDTAYAKHVVYKCCG